MVEDRLGDPTRIAELLASELDGRGTGPLGDVAVVDADTDAVPAPDGAEAYGVAASGTRVGTVRLYPDYVELRLTAGADSAVRVATHGELPARRDGDDAVLRVESGAAVKRAVDAVVAAVTPE